MLEKLPEFVGHALRDTRAGLDQCMSHRLADRPGAGALAVASPAFADHAPLPARHTADGTGTSPPVQWTGVPDGASQVVVVVEDADAPTPHPLVHAIVVDLPARDGALREGALDHELALQPPGRIGRNSFMGAKWLPPDPPPGHGPHRYLFQVFVLGAGEPLGEHAGREKVWQAVSDRFVASGVLTAVYGRPDGTVKAADEAVAPPAATT